MTVFSRQETNTSSVDGTSLAAGGRTGRTMLKGAVEGLLLAERDRRVAEATRRGRGRCTLGFTCAQVLTTLWGSLEQVRVPRAARVERDRAAGAYDTAWLDEVLFALTVGGLSQRKGGGLGAAILGGTLRQRPLARS